MKKYIVGYFIIVYVLLLTSISTFASNDIFVPEDAIEYEKHFYKLYELNMSWEKAEEYFESVGGHLATITSPEEDKFIYNYITSLNYKSAFFGATDKKNEGTWEWVTGEEFLYSNWHQDEPNDEFNNEDYIMYYEKYPDGTWNDASIENDNTGQDKFAYICEWDNIAEVGEQNLLITNESIKSVNISANQEVDTQENSNSSDRKVVFEFHIDNLSIIGGLSILGGVSFIGLFIKKKRKEE